MFGVASSCITDILGYHPRIRGSVVSNIPEVRLVITALRCLSLIF